MPAALALQDRELLALAVHDEQQHPVLAVDFAQARLDLGDGGAGLQHVGEQDPAREVRPLGAWCVRSGYGLDVEPQPLAVDAGRREHVTLQPEGDGRDPPVDLADGRVAPEVGDEEVVVTRDPGAPVDPADDTAASVADATLDVVPLGDALEGQVRTLGKPLQLLLEPHGERPQPGQRPMAKLVDVQVIGALGPLPDVAVDVVGEPRPERVPGGEPDLRWCSRVAMQAIKGGGHGLVGFSKVCQSRG